MLDLTGKEIFELARRAGLLSGAYSGLSYEEVREFTTNDGTGRGVMQACEETAQAVNAEGDGIIAKLDPQFILEGRYAGEIRLVVAFRGDEYAAMKAAQNRILNLVSHG